MGSPHLHWHVTWYCHHARLVQAAIVLWVHGCIFLVISNSRHPGCHPWWFFFLILTHILMLLNYFLQVCFTYVKILIIKRWYTPWSAVLVSCMSSWYVRVIWEEGPFGMVVPLPVCLSTILSGIFEVDYWCGRGQFIVGMQPVSRWSRVV